MWLKLIKKQKMINLRMVKEISVENDTTIIFKYNNEQLKIKKGEDVTELEWDELTDYIDKFDKYCVD